MKRNNSVLGLALSVTRLAIAGGLLLAFLLTFSTQALAQGGTWTTKASMPTARLFLQGAAANGLLYAVGGHNGTRNTPIVEAYNPASNLWSTVASLNAPNYGGDTGRYQGSAVGVNGKVYMMGGWTNSPPLPSNTLSIYDPSTNAWSAGPAIPGSGFTACSEAAVIGSKIYLLNACNGFSGFVQQLSIFDTVANSWTTGPNAPRNHNAGLGAALNGKFYVAGGTDGNPQPQVDVYDPAANTWTTVAGGNMPVNLIYMTGDVINGKWYIVGGSDPTETNFKNTLWIYDPAANTWTSGPEAPTARWAATAATINGKLYVGGGANSTGILSVLEVFDPSVNSAPVANAGPDQTLECANPAGTLVTLNGSGSSDPDAGDTLTYEWTDENANVVGTAASVNVTVPLGTHTFTLKVTDAGALSSAATTHVTVQDTTPPELTLAMTSYSVILPVGQTTATLNVLTESGAWATDLCDPSPAITNNAPSLFPVGTTVVMITATDASGNFSEKAFSVEVLTAAQAIQSLSTLVASYNLQQGIANSLDTKLQNAQAALEAANAGQRQDAQNKILAFISAVEAQRGKQLTSAQADSLIAAAMRVLAVL